VIDMLTSSTDSSPTHCLATALRYATEDRTERAQRRALTWRPGWRCTVETLAAAVDLYRRCLEVAQRIDDQVGQCWSHCRTGGPLRLLDQHDEALPHLFRASGPAGRLHAATRMTWQDTDRTTHDSLP
jgi:hypothetical protein